LRAIAAISARPAADVNCVFSRPVNYGGQGDPHPSYSPKFVLTKSQKSGEWRSTRRTLTWLIAKGIFMQMLFGNGRWTYTIAIAATVAGVLNASNVAHAADSGICIFMKKVLATQEVEFSPLKGNENPTPYKDKTTFHGTLSPERGRTCLL
jgi:hypothetical protein